MTCLRDSLTERLPKEGQEALAKEINKEYNQLNDYCKKLEQILINVKVIKLILL